MPNQIYLYFGDEDYLIAEKVTALKQRVENPSLNIEEIEADPEAYAKIVAALQTQPFFGAEKLIIIRNIDLKDKEWARLIESLKLLSPGVKVVFWASGASRNTKIYKFIDEVGEVYEFKSFTEWQQDELVSWIMQRVKLLDKEIERSAASRLQEICGNSLRKLVSEIDKIITYIGSRKKIKEQDVLDLASPGEANTFALSDALSDKDLPKALSVFDSLVKNKVQIFPLLGLLASQYRTMLQIKSLKSGPAEAARSLKASPYYIRKLSAKAARFSLEELKNILFLLHETDLKLKSGEPQLNALNLMIVSLCGK